MKKESLTLNYYDGIAKGYKNLYHQEQIDKINLIKDYLPKEGIVLDLGSGDGVLNQFFSNEDVNLISLDLSFELLKLNSNKNKIQASAQNLPLKDESVDFISSFTVFQDLPNPILALEEVNRVLKKGGIFILSFLTLAKHRSDIIKFIDLNMINNNFDLIKEFEDPKDLIFVLQKNK